MQITTRYTMLAGMMACGSVLIAGLGVYALTLRPKRRPDACLSLLCMAAGFAFMGGWLWKMAQAMPLPRLAHFDGVQIRLDAPYPLEANMKLIVTVFPADPPSESEEREAWLGLSARRLEDAYSNDTPNYP